MRYTANDMMSPTSWKTNTESHLWDMTRSIRPNVIVPTMEPSEPAPDAPPYTPPYAPYAPYDPPYAPPYAALAP